MQTEVIDLEYERYKDWDMSNAKPANTHPLVKDTDTRVHVNEMIRQVMAIDKQHKENLA